MIKRLSQCVREYKKDALLSPLYVLVESFLDVAIPFVMADLIDKGIEAGNMPMILRYGALLVGFALVALACVLPFIYVVAGWARWPGPTRPRALPATCAMICSTICRFIPFPISINSAAPGW